MPNVTVYLIGALVVAVLVAGAGYKGYSLGQDNIRAEYAARDLANANEQAAKTKEIEERYRAKEQASAQALAQVSTDYERKLTDAQGKTRIALDAIRSGALRLRDPYADNQAGRGCVPDATASAPGRNDPAPSELSGKLAEYLVSEATRADAYTTQLGACQAALRADRQ